MTVPGPGEGAPTGGLREALAADALRALTVVVDAAHGTAGRTARALLDGAPDGPGLGLVVLRADPAVPADDDATADPASTVPDDVAAPAPDDALRAEVVARGADLGLALDASGAAVTVLDEQGDPVDESVVAVLVALHVVARERERDRTPVVVHDTLASRALLDLASGAGADLVRVAAGGSAVADAVATTGACLGVGHGGRYVLPRIGGVEPGLAAGLLVAAALGGQPHPMSLLAELYRPYTSTGVLHVTAGDAAAAVERVHDAYVAHAGGGPVDVDALDGLTVSHWGSTPQWWFTVRASDTGDAVRLLVEAADEDIMDKVRDDVLALVREAH